MHVYHYAPYERTALQRLMGEHGTREDELDDLLPRRGARRPLPGRRARRCGSRSTSYSIKEVEAFYGFERTAGRRRRGRRDGRVRGVARGGRGRDPRGDPRLQRGGLPLALELHRWLLELRPPELAWRQPPEEREVKEETKERLDGARRVEAELLAGAEEGEPRWLLAHLLEYHRREEKPQWWEYFHHRRSTRRS